MTEEIKIETANVPEVLPQKPRTRAKRDIFRFNGEKPTAINLEHVTNMYLEGKRITFQFYSTATFVEMEEETSAQSVFDVLLTAWSGEL
jgi:hypothetical protein